MKIVMKYIAHGSLLLALLVGSGCVAIKGKDLPQIGLLGAKNGVAKKSISVEASYTVNGRSTRGTETLAEAQLEYATKVLSECGMFDPIIMGHDKQYTDYRLTYQVDEKGNAPIAFISGFVCGYTFGLLPGFGPFNHTVNAKLENGDGSFLAEKTYKNKATMVMWLPLLPVMLSDNLNFFTSSKAYMHNYYRHSVIDLVPEYP